MEYIACLPTLTGSDGKASEEATISFVYINEGDTVNEGDDLIEMVTDKATFNMPSPKTGKILEVYSTEDTTIRVGDKVCRMEIEE